MISIAFLEQTKWRIMKKPKEIVSNRDEIITNILIGLGLINAIIFLFISGKFISAIKGFLTIFGEWYARNKWRTDIGMDWPMW